MTAQITSHLRTTQLTNFVNAFNEEVESDDFKSLYVVLCKDTPWDQDGAGRIESDPGFTVPPVDEDDIETMWNDSLVFVRLHTSNILPVVHECTFESGDRWHYDEANVPAGSWERSFASTVEHKSIMRNSEGRVYQCIQEPAAGTCYIGGNVSAHTTRVTCEAAAGATWIPEASTMEPTGLPAVPDEEMIFGKYTWKYLWTLDNTTIVDKVNHKWQPVSYNLYSDGGMCYIDGQPDLSYTTKEECDVQLFSNWVYNSVPYFEQHSYGIDPDLSVSVAKATNLMIAITLSDGLVGSDITSFRQIFLVDTPYTATDEKATDIVKQPSEMSEVVSGNIFFIENKAPVNRSEDQRESIKLILRF